MYVYVPTKKVDKAPIIVAIHYCTGTAQKYFSGSNCASLADTHGFIVICPNSPSSGGCWDVASTSSLTHGKGGDSETIVNMVKYAVTNYGGDADRVFATGSSPGAMMTNVLAGAYPDVFKAGSVYSGVPDACFYVSGATTRMATPDWSNSCANGQNIKTTQAWGNLGNIFHGTADNTFDYPNLAEQMKEWSNVFSISFTKNVTNTPQSGYTQMVYGDGTKLVGYSTQGVGHAVPIHESMDLSWGIA
ncbi:putative Acetylxylan esterase A [Acephala macrosclerotiorum]|nr:putative Acetylxylan esterase A [Acephala macrosclerotiorum]